MHDSQNLLYGKGKYFVLSVLLLFTAAISVAFSMAGGDDFTLARREILLRGIGHELLLQSGDSTSRVLPVKKLAANEYQISFEDDLTFIPDSLMNITRRLLAHDPLVNDYIVNVLKSGNAGVAYGYAVSKNNKDDIVPCKGRKQPRASYVINIKFNPTGINTVNNGYLLGGLPFLAFVGFVFFRSVKPRRTLYDEDKPVNTLTLGSVLFDVKHRKLIVNENTIDLTGTETRILLVFASSPNKIIERSRLQKEIWEDEGVIVGRSLDMFILKLRKKLEFDPDVNIVVIRGKGYRLEITNL